MTDTPRKVLVLDPDPRAADALVKCLAAERVSAAVAPSIEAAIAALESRPVDVVVAALDACGAKLELIATVAERWPAVPVVVQASEAQLARAVDALKAGAADFILEPIVVEQVVYVVGKALASAARRTDDAPTPPGAILGESRVIQQACSVLRRAAAGTSTVLVRGESGTGKELVARALHEQSPRAAGPFVKIDCASLPEALLESELFGYEKGAFTGAVGKKPGRVELAEGGTLFLDEIGELSATLQAKLLRLLQDRELERLGGTKTIRVDVRVVAATHRDLETMIERGQFRQDLFYRLNVVPLWLPPLRARRSDIDLLARHFVASFGAANGKPSMEIGPAALKVLRGQRWPGNVRQLQNVVERLVVLAESSTITEEAVRAELSQQVRFVTQPNTTGLPAAPVGAASVVGPLDAEMREAEKKALARALKHAGGNRTLAARLLGVSRSTFYEKFAEYGLS